MTTFAAVIAAVLGAAIGSFLNVVIHRVPRGLSLVSPGSRCTACGTPIPSRDNIPILSYVLLRGRCRACGVHFSARYPLVEAANAALWAGAVLRYGPTERAAFAAMGMSVLLALSGIDLEHRRLPNVIVLPAVGYVVTWVTVVSAVEGRWRIAVTAVASGTALFGVLLLIALVSGGMGFGDVKLAAFVGLYAGRFGAGAAVAALLGAFIAGGLVAVALVATGKRGRKDAVPFGPALACGAVLAVFLGPGPVHAWLGV